MLGHTCARVCAPAFVDGCRRGRVLARARACPHVARNWAARCPPAAFFPVHVAAISFAGLGCPHARPAVRGQRFCRRCWVVWCHRGSLRTRWGLPIDEASLSPDAAMMFAGAVLRRGPIVRASVPQRRLGLPARARGKGYLRAMPDEARHSQSQRAVFETRVFRFAVRPGRLISKVARRCGTAATTGETHT